MLTAYLIISIIASIGLYVYSLYEDLTIGPSKMGYNYNNPIIWIVCTALAIPIINMVLVIFVAMLVIRYYRYNKEAKTK